VAKRRKVAGPWVDEDLAGMLPDFFSSLKQCKGEHSGKGLTLQPWQFNEVIKPLFCQMRPDGLRQYRQAFLALPRKAGKTTLAAAIALYLLLADDEQGGEIVSAAADAAQASICFEIAKQMILQHPGYSRMCQVYRREIVNKTNGTIYKVISSTSATKHGYNCSGVIVDEVHAHPNRDLIEVLQTSVGARRQPILAYITTAGHDRQSICYEMWKYASQVRDGVVKDASFLPLIYAADKEDDWRKPETWAKANPGIGITIKEDYLRQACEEAQANGARETSFKTLHLNQWVESVETWIPSEKWNLCQAERPTDEDLLAAPCYMGIDLSTSRDLSAIVLAFSMPGGKIWLEPYAFAPRESIKERERKNLQRYDHWAAQGLIELIDGEVIDFRVIKKRIFDLAEKWSVRSVIVDRWQAAQLSQEIAEAGLEVVGHGMSFYHMAPTTKLWEEMVATVRIQHPGHEVFNWCLANTVVEMDPSGNRRASKAKSTERIDLTIAAMLAVSRLHLCEASGSSDYGGLVVL